MNLSPEQIEFLAERGLSTSDIISFARIETARSSGAERQARYRARQKALAVEGDVTRDVTESDVSPSLSPSPLPSPQTPQPTPRPHTHPNTNTRARKGHRLPEDWQPKPLTAALEADLKGVSSGAIERELARFRDWAAGATGPNAVKADWDAAWRNWLRKAYDEGRLKNAKSASNSNTNDNRDGAMRAIDRRLGLDDVAGTSGRRNAGQSHRDSPLRIAAPSGG